MLGDIDSDLSLLMTAELRLMLTLGISVPYSGCSRCTSTRDALLQKLLDWVICSKNTVRSFILLASRVVLCLSLCLSVTSRCSVETAERIRLVSAWLLPSTYPTLCNKEFSYLQK